MQNIINRTAGYMFAVAFVVIALASAPVAANAADMDIDSGGSWVTDSATPYYAGDVQDSGGSWVTDSATPYYDAQDSSGMWVTDSATSFYSSTPSYSSGYGVGGYSTGGYSIGGYSSGGYMSGYSYPVYTTPHHPTPAPATPVVNNTCVGTNNCNTNIDSHNVAITQTQVCQSGFYGTYPNCYVNTPVYTQPVQPIVYQQPVVAYSNTPYVSLSQVPYTGLELGFWGSIAYWGAFILFALFAAYLIAIKRVQNNIAAYFKSVLFGTDEETVEVTTVETAPAVETIEVAPTPVVAATNADVIDSFIMNQINRARTA